MVIVQRTETIDIFIIILIKDLSQRTCPSLGLQEYKSNTKFYENTGKDYEILAF